MLARIRKAQENNEGGFTLIELLVVMIIIGILAAIAIPAFLSQRAKAQDTAAKADVAALGKELATFYVDGTGTVAVTGDTTITAASKYTVGGTDAGRQSDNVTLNSAFGNATSAAAASVTVGAANGTTFCIGVVNAKGSQKTYKYSSANGLQTGQCASAIAP